MISIGMRRLVFRYSVQASDRDTDGISIVADALALPNGVTLRGRGDASTWDAQLGLGYHAIYNAPGHRVDGGGTTARPAFDAVASPLTYAAGTAVEHTLPSATGSGVTYRLGATPALPAGLTFDKTTRVLSGTPTERRAYLWIRLGRIADAIDGTRHADGCRRWRDRDRR